MASHPHFSTQEPSDWVLRFAALIPARADVLDLACGGGRHARWLAANGFNVLAADRDRQALDALDGLAGLSTLCTDLEQGEWPWSGAVFDAAVVTRYLFRPRLDRLAELLKPGGLLIYETFMDGNARFGKPSNPDFLLRPHELLDWVRGWGSVLAFEQGEIASPVSAMMQRVCAVKSAHLPLLP